MGGSEVDKTWNEKFLKNVSNEKNFQITFILYHKLQHTPGRIWTCKEPKFWPSLMEMFSSAKHISFFSNLSSITCKTEVFFILTNDTCFEKNPETEKSSDKGSTNI